MAGGPLSEPGADRRLTVWYDGACPLCSAEIRLTRKLDRDNVIAFVDLRAHGDGSTARAALLAQPRGEPMVSGAAAFVAMWRLLPGLRVLAAIASPAPMMWMLERCYRLFLRVRPALQAVARRLERPAGDRAG
jgi:predicted DCC family thiol-disulfide oxidoreductase YuxK